MFTVSFLSTAKNDFKYSSPPPDSFLRLQKFKETLRYYHLTSAKALLQEDEKLNRVKQNLFISCFELARLRM